MSSIHDGHRSRMRNRLHAGGMEGFQDHEILEWLLFHTIPRGDVNPLAHRLIREFGSLSGVLEADKESLKLVEGVGESTALFLSSYLSVYERYLESSRKKKNNRLNNLDEIAEYFRRSFVDSKQEELRVLLLGNTLNIIREDSIAQGSMRAVQMDMRRLVTLCLNSKAVYVVLGHNHPSEILFPSDSDVKVTRTVAELLRGLDLRLLDHLIVGKEGYYSMAQSKETSYIFFDRVSENLQEKNKNKKK